MINFRKQLSHGMVHQVVVERVIDGMTMYCVIGERTGQNFGCYTSRADAEARLEMIMRFSMDN